MAILCKKQIVTQESAETDLALLEKVFGKDVLAAKTEGIVLDMMHSGTRMFIATLATVYRVAQRYNLDSQLLEQLLKLDSFIKESGYGEIIERYLTLIILEGTIPILSAHPEKKILGDKNPDWTIDPVSGEQFHVEVSAITIKKVIDDIASFSGRLQTSRAVASCPFPLYFEVIFYDNPRMHDPNVIGEAILSAAKAGIFPISFEYGGAKVNVDTLSNRRVHAQLISAELNDANILKSTSIKGDRLAYTIAAKIDLKSLERKIDEKKKSNCLKEIGNTWLAIFMQDEDLDRLNNDESRKSLLAKRVAASGWLRKIVVATLIQDASGIWSLRYLLIG